MRDARAWLPAAILALGVALVATTREPADVALRAPLASLPTELAGLAGEARTLPPEELAANGASDYLLRAYRDGAGRERVGLYVGYYAHQRQGRTIHSPKNCLPGGGWEPLSASVGSVLVDGAAVPVNRYVIANGSERALVYYWYQGRGRVAADEYLVKWHLLRDAATRARTEEALVRLVVPLAPGDDEAVGDALARDAATRLVPELHRILPG